MDADSNAIVNVNENQNQNMEPWMWIRMNIVVKESHFAIVHWNWRIPFDMIPLRGRVNENKRNNSELDENIKYIVALNSIWLTVYVSIHGQEW